MAYTKQDMELAYGKLVHARGLVSHVRTAGLDLSSSTLAEWEGNLLSIFAILDDYLEPAEEILDHLQMGYKDLFSQVLKKEGGENAE